MICAVAFCFCGGGRCCHRECSLSELLYAGDLVLVIETIEGLMNKFLKWKEAFGSKGLKVNIGKTRVMVSHVITLDDLSKSTVDPYGVCCLRVNAKSVLFIPCGKWIHGRCAAVKRVTFIPCGKWIHGRCAAVKRVTFIPCGKWIHGRCAAVKRVTFIPCGKWIHGRCAAVKRVTFIPCGKWIHGRCAAVKRVTQKFQRNF